MVQTYKHVELAPGDPGKRCCPGFSRWLPPKLFKALGDPTRLSLLDRIASGGGVATATVLAGECPLDVSVVSRHLHTLCDAGILRTQRKGKEVRFQIDAAALSAALRSLADALDAGRLPGTGEGDGRKGSREAARRRSRG